MYRKIAILMAILFVPVLAPALVSAKISFSELMFDPLGSDTDREWFEIINTGPSSVNIKDLRFEQGGTKHKISTTTTSVGLSSAGSIGSGDVAVVVTDEAAFKKDSPNFQGILLRSSFSLKNTGEKLSINNGDNIDDTLDYTESAIGFSLKNDQGFSLQKNRDGKDGWSLYTANPGVSSLSNISNADINNTDLGTGSSGTTSSDNSSSNTNSSATTSTQTILNNAGEDSGDKDHSVYYPSEPHILAKIRMSTEKYKNIVGVAQNFKASAWGNKKEPLSKAGFYWNFGDGVVSNNQNTEHVYRYPGSYIVSMSAISEPDVFTDYMEIEIKPAKIVVSQNHLNSSENIQSFIELYNQERYSVDIGGFILLGDDMYSKRHYIFPEHSVIKAKTKVRFNIEDIKFRSEKIKLLYPNGQLVGE